MNEADTCRKYVLPKLYAAGWDGRADQRAAHLHRWAHRHRRQAGLARAAESAPTTCCATGRDFPIAVVEAKAAYKNAGDGLQQAKEYAADSRPQVRLCHERPRHHRVRFPDRPGERARKRSRRPTNCGGGCGQAEGIGDREPQAACSRLATISPASRRATTRKSPSTAPCRPFSRARSACCSRMATGTGKTLVAFQICWKLWNSRWNRTGEHRRPRSSTSPTATSWSTTQRTRSSRPSAMPAGRSRARRSRAARCTSPSIRPSPRTSAAPASTANTPRISSTSSSWTSATGAAPATRATGARSWNTSSPPSSLA